MLKKAASYFGPVLGSIVGGFVGGGLGIPGIGSAVGAGAGVGAAAKESARFAADKVAVQRFNQFVETVRQDGSQRLEALLGQAAHEHLMGSPQGRAALSKWVNSLGTTALKGATKTLAVVTAQSVKQPNLNPVIEAELNKLAASIGQ
jgi:hypothetical protein